MFTGKSVTGIVFAALLLLSPHICLRPAAAEISDPGQTPARQITVSASDNPDTSGQQPVAIQQAIDKAVPAAVPVQQAGPNNNVSPSLKPATPSGLADKPVAPKAHDAAKAAPAKPPQADQVSQVSTAVANPAQADQNTAQTNQDNAAPAPPADDAIGQKQCADGPPSPSEFIKSEDSTVLSPTAQQGSAQQQPNAVVEDALKVKPGSSDLLGPVERNIEYFSSTIKKHFTQWLARSGKYVGLMKSILRENYVPEDLVFLSLIESGFNPKAYSMARASGPWQFIKGTAVRYGLRVDRWVDERRDPVKSTKAAAAYLKDLYDMFGSWPLAMASYNCGEGNILRAVKRNDTEDFWELRKTRSIPSETKDYVPKFVAARMIAKDPQQYGFNDLTYEKPFEFEEVTLDHCTDLATVAKCCEVPESEIKDLNPELLRGCTPPNRSEYTLRVPKGTKDTFLKNYAALPDDEKVASPPRVPTIRRYVVRRGDTLRSIARRFHVPAITLAKANRLRVKSRVRQGRHLIVPGYERTKTSEAVADNSDNGGEPEAHSKSVAQATYRVKKGDTLASIARRHHISVAQLARLNRIRAKSRLKPGQRLALAKTHPEEKVARAETASRKAVKKHGRKKYARKKIYRVRRGDTLYSIAKKFNVSRDKLAQVNSISGSSIKKGQKLVIPDGDAA